jgi:ATP-binding cassette, subfamily B, bacterial PglK
MLSLFILTSAFEVIGVGLVGPFIALATNPEAIRQNAWLAAIYAKLSITSENQFLLIMGLGVVAIFYVKAFFSFSAQKYIFEFGFGQQAELSSRLMKAYLAAPYTFHLTRNSASLIQNIISETDRFANGLLMPLLTFISNSIVTLALIILLVATNALAMIIITGALLVAFIIIYALKDRLKQWGKESSEASTEIICVINHSLGGLKETKVIGCESYFEDQIQKQVEKFGRSSALAVSFSNLPRFMIEAFLITFLIAFTILFINSSNGNPQNLSSVLGIFALASIRLLPAISNMTSAVAGLRYNAFSLDKIYFDLKELQLIDERKSYSDGRDFQHIGSNEKPVPFVNQISLDNVAYRYPNAEKDSLASVSLTIKKGQSIGVIGKSGAGKTTLIDVILGLLIPQGGDITADGISIYTNLRSWQDMIGYVPQSIFLIDATLKQNVAFGVPKDLIDHERLSRAIAAAQLSELVAQLPHGLETKVGERGVLLSGGQRQRVGIARALYHEREILVFDEATAALDNETEALVTEAIKSLSGIKTMIIIAHRLSTIEHCDRIYMLEKGKVVKSGSYQEVVSVH